jgi:predicted phosphoribosyltransferase
MYFRDRADAGHQLASHLEEFARRAHVLVLALPRGGVPVAFEVARALEAPLDVFLVRKLGVPFQPELAMGAIASGGTRVLNEVVVDSLLIPPQTVDLVSKREQAELERRERVYRGGRPAPSVRDKTVILVDDGIATGSSMRAAILALREQGARHIVVAVPVAPHATACELARLADRVVCVLEPEEFQAIGQWYDDFSQLSDQDVVRLLEHSVTDLARAG